MKRLILPNKPPRQLSGFTLIEILLVMLLISILVLGINAAYRQAHAFWSRINATQPIYAQSRTLFNTLRQELSSLYLPKTPQDEEGQKPPTYFSVKSGTEISFLSLNPSWSSISIISKPAKITYSFKNSTEGIATLIRSEQVFSGEKAIGTETKNQVVLSGLSGIKIQAQKGSGDDSENDNPKYKEKPPQAVKIQLVWPESKNSDVLMLECTIPILCYGNISSESQ